VAIFYHYQFRMKKSVEFTPDGIKALKSKAIEKPAKDLLDCRKPFRESLARIIGMNKALTATSSAIPPKVRQ
jgi:hypothetical protein